MRERATTAPNAPVVSRRIATGEALMPYVDLDPVRSTTQAEISRHAAQNDVEASRDVACACRGSLSFH